jgi:hypothetical protein
MPQTPSQLRNRIKNGDWLKIPSKCVAFEVRVHENGIELLDDWAKSYPVYEWESTQEFILITAEAMSGAIASSQ